MENSKKVIAIVSKALNSTPNGVSFFSIKGYTNAQGEKSNRKINIGTSLKNAKATDVEYLTNLDVKTLKSDMDVELLEEARVKLLEALVNPTQKSKNQSKGQVQAYTKINEAVKFHNETLALYVFGFIERDENGNTKKTILKQGEYKADTRKPLTKAKDLIRKGMKSTKYRQFKVEAQPEQVQYSGGSDTILVEMV